MVSENILVVEDESIIALDIERSLLNSGYNVVAIASCAEAAIEAVIQHHPELVLMDVRIQGEKDGIETATLIQSQFDLPVIYLTAHADEDTLRRVKLTQPFGYVLKPFQDQDLAAAIEVALCRHQAEVKIRQALTREKELNELKSHFVSIVSHEFRNPLSTILVSLNLLSQFDQKLTPEQKQSYIQRAQSSVVRMNQLLNDVLILGETESAGMQFTPIPLDLTQFCRDLIEDFRFNSGAKHTVFFTERRVGNSKRPISDDFSPAETDLPLIDEKLLRHILTNLLSNAIKYSPQGGKVELAVIYESEQITFHIKDAGIGIPPEDITHLFTSFQRGSNVSKISGTGLGLSIVKQCVEAHQGSITVESSVGVGSTFIVNLPLATATQTGFTKVSVHP